MPASPSERSLIAQSAAHTSWARTDDRTARTAPAREALLARFEREVDPEGKLPPEERARRAASARKAYMADLSRRRVKNLRLRREAEAKAQAEAEATEIAAAEQAQ